MVGKAVYTLTEVAALMGFCANTVTRLFENEPGVILLKRPANLHKRSYRSIRIPRGVYERVLDQLRIR